MKCCSFNIVVLSLALLLGRAGADVIVDRITTISGKSAEQVTEYSKELDGRVKITHVGGVWRISQSELTNESQIALGLVVETGLLRPIADLQTLQTINGRKYDGIWNCVATPSGIRFIHSTGAATIPFSELSADIRTRCGYDSTKAAAYDRQIEKGLERGRVELLNQLLSVGPGFAESNTIWVDTISSGTQNRVLRKVNRMEAHRLAASFSGAWVWVAGHYRYDGTYVPGHYRTGSDKSTANNWSTEGNRNPHTGELGDLSPVGSGYSSGSIRVRSYTRKDGTRVRSHSRRK